MYSTSQTATGEPVTEQAPTTPATDTATIPSLPDGYLSDGYLATTEKGKKYLRHVYVADYAEQLAEVFSASMKPSDFAALVRTLKSKKTKSYPFEARQTAIAQAQIFARTKVHKKKAPSLLLDFLEANNAAIHNDEEWYAFFEHIEAINNLIVSAGD